MDNRSREECFENIYNTNHWTQLQSESKSGMGSTLDQTQTIIEEIPKLLAMFNIESILDASCGDFNWMRHIDLSNYKYIGMDIVKPVIEQNNRLYAKDNITFMSGDIVSDLLPKSDLIFCRDCLVHLSVSDVKNAIKNFIKSGSTYLLTTTFDISRKNNLEMKLGSWHPINLMGPPYNLPLPIYSINENCTEGNNGFRDKSLALWKLDELIID